MGPVTVGVHAAHLGFQLYTAGIYDDEKCGDATDHAMTLVGYRVVPRDDYYSEEPPTAYYIAKNSWGPEWGMEGYMKLKVGVGPMGVCGVASQSSQPIKNETSPDPGPAPPGPPRPSPPPPPPPGAKIPCGWSSW